MPWVTSAQSNLYFLHPKEFGPKFQNRPNFISHSSSSFSSVMLIYEVSVLRSLKENIFFFVFFPHFLVNQTDPLDSPFREISHSVRFLLSSIFELYSNPNIPIQIPQILILFGFSLHCRSKRNRHGVLGDNPNFRSDWDHCVYLHQNLLQ